MASSTHPASPQHSHEGAGDRSHAQCAESAGGGSLSVRSHALQLLQGQQWMACMQLLERSHGPPANSAHGHGDDTSTHATPCDWASSREATQAMLIATAHHYGTRNQWRAVLRLTLSHAQAVQPAQRLAKTEDAKPDVQAQPRHMPGIDGSSAAGSAEGTGSTDAAVRRQYRRAAALVHPDKCDLPHAESAFRWLGQALKELLQQVCGSGLVDLDLLSGLNQMCMAWCGSPNSGSIVRASMWFFNNVDDFMMHIGGCMVDWPNLGLPPQLP